VLTVNWSFTPAAKWAGTVQNLYLSVRDKGGLLADWNKKGTWSITGGPTNWSLSPGSGATGVAAPRTFKAEYYDPNGASDIALAYMMVGSNTNGNAALWGYYAAATNKLYLRKDDNSSWIGGFAPGSANVISNSQGSLNCAATGVSMSGNILTINWSWTPAAWVGTTQNLYLYARDKTNLNDGYDQMGTWTITGNPTNVSLTPNSGSSMVGVARNFTTRYVHPNTVADISYVQLLVNTSTSVSGALWGYYLPAANKLYLRKDDNSGWLGGFAPGSANVISNSQGSLDCATTSFSMSGNTLTVNWNFTPAAKWAGTTQNLYLYVRDKSGLSDGWDQMGTWSIVSSAGTPASTPPSLSD
jgi:hypothetical protein